MSEFQRTDFNLKRLVDNSFRAIDHGTYKTSQTLAHDVLSLKKAISQCRHAPLITEIKFSSPSQGKIREKAEPAAIAKIMVSSGAIGLSVVTQPSLFDGSIEYLARIRNALTGVPLLMKDIIVSTVQIDACRQIGGDCILLIKSVFDRNLAENSMEKLWEYARNKGLEVIVEVHSENEFREVIEAKYELVGINNRNLENLEVDISNTEKLLKRYGKGYSVIISESGIASPQDIQYLRRVGADAFLVGTTIMQTHDIGSKVSELYYAI
jgi:indole-3-glycerol phosphate synthase